MKMGWLETFKNWKYVIWNLQSNCKIFLQTWPNNCQIILPMFIKCLFYLKTCWENYNRQLSPMEFGRCAKRHNFLSPNEFLIAFQFSIIQYMINWNLMYQLSKMYFSRTLKEIFGCPIIQYGCNVPVAKYWRVKMHQLCQRLCPNDIFPSW